MPILLQIVHRKIVTLESKSPIPKLSDLYSGKVLTYTL